MSQRLLGLIQDAGVCGNGAIDVKSKDHHLAVSRVNLKQKFRKGDYLPRSCDVVILQVVNLRKISHEQ